MLLLSSADFFSKFTFSKNSFRNTIRLSNSLDTDQDRPKVGPDLGPNCLQRLSADDKCYQQTTKVATGKERVLEPIMTARDDNFFFSRLRAHPAISHCSHLLLKYRVATNISHWLK